MTLRNASRLHFLHHQNPNNSHRRLHRNKVRFSRRSFPVSRHPHLLPFQRIPNSKVIRGMNWDNLELGNESEDSDLSSVELSYTRTLSPALTLEHGFNKIEEEVEKLNLDPPTSKSGIVRIQVAVPPSAKALSWFCNQPQSQEVLPQFYLCKNTLDSLPLNSHLFDGVPGVSGIGASVCFTGSSHLSKEWSSMKRYLSVDSPLIRAYGFIGINFDMESSFIKHGSGSFYFVIPQIELDEYEGISLLAATLAWDGHSTFDKAIHSFKLSLSQASKENYQDKCITSDLGKSTLMEEKNVQMVSINANSIEQNETRADHLQPKEASTSSKFCFRLSSTLAVTHNVLDHPRELGCLLRGSANINSVWASLIVEECTRLGLTYFCIAPGSRSSPLAVAASTHPRTTCIACFDERSLAFHAVGYARGSYRPAVVITSSGTAVSNLFPAVVEASQDLVPLLLLTADRPPELHDAGANQAINQVHHFGTYVRFFFNLPTPTDRIPARMVLTTIDSAVFRATTAPNGPVHINCPFREPLEDAPRKWMLSCLKGLDFWISRDEPFTKYIRIQHSHACGSQRQVGDVFNMIQCANKGLLLIGSIHTEDEMWAALHLSKHLSWPTVTDILSGLRFKSVLTEFPQFTEKVLFVDHLDHALLSESVRDWAQPDVIIQIGSRITSKRVSQMLEFSSPRSYIMVDKHPYRHDPSHIVTHRIQSTIVEFADSLLKLQLPRRICKWSGFMHAVNVMVAREIEFQIHSEYSLTEPHIAQVVSDALPSDAALFFGNSMVIRDADMYGCGWMNHATECTSLMSSWELSCIGIRVSGNRGASGIDGLLSTAIGYAIGSHKRVFCVIGDVSFLHDTNGLAIINQRAWRKPLTILVVNNHGGAIFSLLPIAEKTDPSILNRYFYTSHNTAIGKLCEAHSVNHLLVRTKLDLQRALSTSQQVEADFVIEVESCIEDNATFHSILQRSARQAADDTFNLLSRLSVPECTSSDFLSCEIHKMEYSLYRIQLSAPPTSTRISGYPSWYYKEGFILAVYLEDGSVGFGEVAPIEIHKENLQDVEEQLRFFIHVIQGVKPHSIFPSVRCGLEMAILNALSARQGCSLANLLHSECSPSKTHLNQGEKILKKSSSLQICALLDSKGNPMEVAEIADKLVQEGFTTIKIKVGRRANPSEDATVIQEIRKKVGYQVKLRADANRSWTYAQAINFGTAVQNCDLQYIEEPVNLEDEIIKFHEETGLPIALDETIDSIQGDPLGRLAKFVHPGIVAVVIKPSVVGGFENATLIAKWAQKHDKLAVVSSAFESSLSLYAYVQFSYYLEQQNAHRCKVIKKEPGEPVAHGLGTYRWLKEDVTTESLRTCNYPNSEVVEASVEDTAQLLLNFKIDPKVIQRSYTGEHSRRYQMVVDYEDFSSSLDVLEVGKVQDNTVLVFLHGFLGTCEEWIPIMKALSTYVGCISINLPGHGESHIQKNPDKESKQESSIPIDVIANILCKLIGKITHSRVVVVGYSMGARIALYMALRCANQVNGAVIISGSPGLKNPILRRRRILDDDARAKSLRAHGLESFLDAWYSKELWRSLRGHPHFKQIVSSRMQHADVDALANSLSVLSIGRQPCLWEDLKQTQKPLLFLCGEKDKKFKEINQQMFYEVDNASKNRDDKGKHIHEIKEIPNCGHAVHLENPLLVINAISSFLRKNDEIFH